jgi:hypothetical protein
MCRVYSLRTDICAVIKPEIPAPVANGILDADDTLLVVEVHGALKSCQTHNELQSQTIK